MNYPLLSEYSESIKLAEDNFEELKHLRPVLDEDGKPVMSSGNFAVVFKMKDEQTGKLYALKCFTKEQEGRPEAYRMIAEELESVNGTYLTPIKYYDKELFVDSNVTDDTEFPVLAHPDFSVAGGQCETIQRPSCCDKRRTVYPSRLSCLNESISSWS